MSLLFKKSGILTTVQDLGRTGFRRFGINPNGVMDQTAVRLINVLLKNHENEAVIEMHFPAPEINFEEKTVFALGGADFSAELDNKKLENWRIHQAPKNSTLKFNGKISGNRAYLSIKNGLKINKILGSSSTHLTAHFGGFEGRKIEDGDRIFFDRENTTENFAGNIKISNSIIPNYSSSPTLRIIAGAEFEDLTAISQLNFLKRNYKITVNSDRMGFRLKGEPLFLLDNKELISSAVNFGTIQLLPDEQMIVLMADHQTSGGYPRIAHIIKTDLPLLAQLGVNDKVAFQLIEKAEAENLQMRFELDLNLLKTAVYFR